MNITAFLAEIDAKRHISVSIRTKVTYLSSLTHAVARCGPACRSAIRARSGAQRSAPRALPRTGRAGSEGPGRLSRHRSAFVSARPYNANARRRASTAGRAPAPAVRGTARAKVAELVDALDLGSSGATLESSSLSFRTTVGMLRSLARAVRAEERTCRYL